MWRLLKVYLVCNYNIILFVCFERMVTTCSRRNTGIATAAPVCVRSEEQASGEPWGTVVAQRRVRRCSEAHVVQVGVRAGAVGPTSWRGPDRGLRRARPAAQGAVVGQTRTSQGDQKRPGRVSCGGRGQAHVGGADQEPNAE